MNKARGYDIRVLYPGESFHRSVHAWGVEGTLPAEWLAIRQDENVIDAAIYYSTERRKAVVHRRVLDEVKR